MKHGEDVFSHFHFHPESYLNLFTLVCFKNGPLLQTSSPIQQSLDLKGPNMSDQ